MAQPPLAFEDFEWDRGNWAKCQQHGVSIEEIETALRSGAMLILPDIGHSDEEDRLIATGKGQAAATSSSPSPCGIAAGERCCGR